MRACSIYIIKNTINNNVYIGQTWKNINKRFVEHKAPSNKKCIKLYNAFNKYNRDNFYIEELFICLTQELADQMEVAYIQLYNSIKNGYNISYGGQGSRDYRCDKNPRSKLTQKQVDNIREDYKKNISQKELAIKYNISPITISHILNNRTWIVDYKINYNKGNPKKINQYIANQIRSEKLTQKQLSIKYNCSIATINLILHNKIWKV